MSVSATSTSTTGSSRRVPPPRGSFLAALVLGIPFAVALFLSAFSVRGDSPRPGSPPAAPYLCTDRAPFSMVLSSSFLSSSALSTFSGAPTQVRVQGSDPTLKVHRCGRVTKLGSSENYFCRCPLDCPRRSLRCVVHCQVALRGYDVHACSSQFFLDDHGEARSQDPLSPGTVDKVLPPAGGRSLSSSPLVCSRRGSLKTPAGGGLAGRAGVKLGRNARAWIDNLRLRTPRNAKETGRTVRDSFCTGAQEVDPSGWCGDCRGSTP